MGETTRGTLRSALALVTAAAVFTTAGGASHAASTLPTGFTDTRIAAVVAPTALAFLPDGRIVVAAQFGTLRIIENGTLLAQPALDIGAAVCTDNEDGLLGVAPDPAFASNGFLYVYYTRNNSGRCVNRVSRLTLAGNTVDPASEVVLVDEIPATGGYHNAGDVHFGKDGLLYVSVGDGGCDYANDSGCGYANDASRDQNVLVGKILRITSTGGIPPSNPFLGSGTARCNLTGRTTAGNKCQETFAWGLRNPFRIAFDPNASGTRFYINDVGQNTWEEIDLGQAGADYGWNVREGPCVTGSTNDCGPPPAGMTNPIYSYSHAESTCNAITGGAFVPNGAWPSSYDGTYLYGDYTCDKIFLLTPSGSGGFARSEFATGVGDVVNVVFGPSPAGQSLYYTNYDSGGEIHRIDYVGSGNRVPTASVTASPRSGAVPLTVSFDGSGSSDPDTGDTLTYVWDFGDGTAGATTSAPATSHTYTAAGTFTATLVVRDSHGASSSPATVQIAAGNSPPQVSIDNPAAGATFAVGQTITLHGTATDPEDGALPASSLSWVVLRHHDTHTHPFLAPTTGNDVQITGPAPEDLAAAANSYLEIQLTATDSRGVSTTVTRDLLPRKVDLTFATSPAGLRVELNTASTATPVSVTSWEGYGIAVNAPAQTDGSGTPWVFDSWSDGGGASHTITTPAAPASYTARFVQGQAPSGLVAAFGFDEGSGSVAGDASGNGNAGSVSGAAWNASGKFGGALSFDGVDDWVTVADSPSLDLTNALTLEAWVKPSALGTSWRTAILKEASGALSYALYAHTGQLGPSAHVAIGGSEPRARSSTAIGNGVWSHLAATYDGSAIRLYVNGALVVSQAASGPVSSSTGALRIGGNAIWSEWFAGAIDEVRVYARALSSAEIQTDMQTPIGSSPPPPPPQDTTPPTAPGNLTASAASTSISLSWAASTDNVGVVRYDVYRGTTAGFTPSAANRIAQPTTTSYTDSGLASGTYYYRVGAEDAAGNVSAASNEASATIAPPPPPPPSGLVAAFGFDAGSGSVASDASGNGNAGAISGAAWSASGKFGGALSFDGVDDWVTVADSASLDLTSALTLEAWVKPSTLGGSWRTAILKERSGGLCYALYAHTGQLGPSAHVAVDGSEPRARSSTAIGTDVWSHVAATYDGSTIRLYVDGSLVVSQAASGQVTASTGALRIGGNAIWNEWFAGLIDEVRVYGRALSAAEIQTDMQTPVG